MWKRTSNKMSYLVIMKSHVSWELVLKVLKEWVAHLPSAGMLWEGIVRDERLS